MLSDVGKIASWDPSRVKGPAEALGFELTQVIANIVDFDAMERVFFQEQPEIVFHAAAHKHVPLMELHAARL